MTPHDEELMPAIIPAEVQEEVRKSGLEHKKAQTYISRFMPNFTSLSEFEKQIDAINAEEPSANDSKKARDLRMLYVKNRTGAEKIKDELKKGILLEGNLIQSMYNVVMNACKIKEDHLARIEKHAEIKENLRKDQLKAQRYELLKPYVENPDIFPLRDLDEAAFEQLLDGSKMSWEKKQGEARKQQLAQERREELGKYLDPIPEMSYGEMDESTYQDLLTKAKEAAAEKKRLEQEAAEKMRRFNLRIDKLIALGFGINEEGDYYREFNVSDEKDEALTIAKHTVEDLVDDEFAAFLSNAEGFRDAEIVYLSEFAQRQQEEEDKRNALDVHRRAELMPYDPVIAATYLGTFGEEEYQKILAEKKSVFEKKQADQAKADRVAAQLQKEKNDKAAAIAMVKKEREELINPLMEKAGMHWSQDVDIATVSAGAFDHFLQQAREGVADIEKREREEAEARQGDKAKMAKLMMDLEALKVKYAFKSKKNQKLYADVGTLLTKIINHITQPD